MESQWDGHERRRGQPPEQLRAHLQQLREVWEVAHRDTQAATRTTRLMIRMFAHKDGAEKARSRCLKGCRWRKTRPETPCPAGRHEFIRTAELSTVV